MRNERYELRIDDNATVFEFVSEGTKGFIRKRVEFRLTDKANIYILAFGDVDSETDDFDDEAISDNGDTQKVLATVASTVHIFTNTFPKAIVYAEGSNSARTRLYRMGISKNLEELQETFNVFGFLEGVGWFVYEKNKNYSSFFVTKKIR